MKVLSISDKIVSFVYSSQVRSLFGDVDFVISCGDLPYYYLEYVISMLNKPLFFVHGNHDKPTNNNGVNLMHTMPHGGINLHNKVVKHDDILIAGVEGSLRYRPGAYQYSHTEMWRNVYKLIPSLIYNKALYGRYLDVLVTHAPPEGIHDADDLAHQGIKAFRWFLRKFKPAYHFHGHMHIYQPNIEIKTRFEESWVINTYPYRNTELELPQCRR